MASAEQPINEAGTKTHELFAQYRSVPSVLRHTPHWVCYKLAPSDKGGKPKKLPVSPVTGKLASSTDPQTWASFEDAVKALAEYKYAGLGWMLDPDIGIVAVDIDHCYDPATGELNEVAKDIVSMQATYTEISPSGDGIHLWYSGVKGFRECRNDDAGVEIYDRSRYLTITGNALDGTPQNIAEENGALSKIREKYIVKEKAKNRRKKTEKEKMEDEDANLLKEVLLSEEGEVIAELISGEWKGIYPSQSEADLALCRKLSHFTSNPAQMDRLFRKSKLYRDKWDEVHTADGSTYGHETIATALGADTIGVLASLRSGVYERDGQYYCRTKGSEYPITNFTVDPREMIEAVDGSEAYVTARFIPQCGRDVELTISASDFATLTHFKRRLNLGTISLCFFGTEKDLERLKNYLTGLPWTRKRGVRPIGIHKTEDVRAFVTTTKAILAGGEESQDIIQLQASASIMSDILDHPLLSRESLPELGKVILSYNLPSRTVPVLAWCAACFIKPQLYSIGIKYPHLVLSGEAGSGKSTTLEHVIHPIFSINRSIGASQVTRFTLAKELASSNLIPAVIDEYKPSKMTVTVKDAISNALRDSYDRHVAKRGKSDQSIVNYQYLAPIVLAGEAGIDEPAIKERIVDVVFAKRDIYEPEYRGSDKRLIESSVDLSMLGRSLLEESLNTSEELVATWVAEGKTIISDTLPTRITDNYVVAYTGLKLIEAMLSKYALTWNEVFRLPIDKCVDALEYSAKSYLLDDGLNNPSVVDNLLEIMSRSGLEPNVDYILDEGDSCLYLRLKSAYDKTLKYIRDHDIPCEKLTAQQFQSQLKQCEYFLKANIPKRFHDGTPHKVWVLDFNKLAEKAEVEDFRSTSLEEWPFVGT